MPDFGQSPAGAGTGHFAANTLRRILFLAIGLVISVGALYFAFQGFDLGDVWDAMGRVRLPFFLLMIVPYVLTFLTKVGRWQTLF